MWQCLLSAPNIKSLKDKLVTKIFTTALQKVKLNPVNSLQQKTDEWREIVKISNPAFIVITESKIDNSISDSEISIDKYSVIRGDRHRKDGVVICYVTSKIC